MAVKGISVKFNKAQGINQALKAPLGTAEDIINFRKTSNRRMALRSRH
jgi:hypothetical protein